MACSATNTSTTTTSTTTTLIGHTSSVWTSCFSHDQSQIATSSSDETVRVWNLRSELMRGQEVACLTGHTGVVRGCAFSPDSALLATGSWDKSVHIHSCSNLVLRNKFLGHRYGVSAVRFSPNGSVLASCSWDDSIGLWDIQTGTLLGWLLGHTSPVATCIFVEGTSILASCSWDGTVRLWDLSSPAAQGPAVTLKGHPDAVYDMSATSSHPNLLVSCGRKGALMLWDLRSQVPWQALQRNWTELNSVCWSPSGANFITGDNMGELQLWDMTSIRTSTLSATQPKILHGHTCSVTGLSFSKDGHFFASSSSDSTCRVWEAAHAFDSSIASLATSLADQLSLKSD